MSLYLNILLVWRHCAKNNNEF